jgi:hypothetical protein
MTRTIAVLTLGLLTVAAATAQPMAGGVRLYVDAEITGLVKEWKGEFYVLADPNAEQSAMWEELKRQPEIIRETREIGVLWPRMWRIDLAKLDKNDVSKMVGKRVEAVGRAPMRVEHERGHIPMNTRTPEDLVVIDRVILSAKLRELPEKK